MRAVEVARHRLSLAVRVDDHFSGAPWPDELDVGLDTLEPPVEAAGGGGIRHDDGTYRFVGLAPGARQLTVASRDGTAFAWTPATPVVLPLASPVTPIVVEMWPSPRARIAAGTLVIRGRLAVAAAGQEVRMQVVGVVPPRIRRTRCDADGELTFVVAGPVALTASRTVELDVSVPGRVLTSIQILDGDTNPTTAGTRFAVAPGRETRVRFNLT
jgi:hypothetical protein